MSEEPPRQEVPEAPEGPVPSSTEGLPWQVVYSAFLGVLLCALGFYGGLYLWGLDGGSAALGVGLIVASVGLAACFVALLTGASWALSVCRITTMAAMAIMLANLAWRLVEVPSRPEWRLPGARALSLFVDALFEPHALMLLAGLAACACLLCLLLGPTVRRFCGRA